MAAQLVGQLNTIVSRVIPATAPAVLSVTQVNGGHTHNVMPADVRVAGMVRTFGRTVQDRIEIAIREMSKGIATAHRVDANVGYHRYYPATVNCPIAAAEALAAAAIVGTAVEAPEPSFCSEDFAFMLDACPGAYLWLGPGTGGDVVPLHDPAYDFNDNVLPLGVHLHVALARLVLGMVAENQPS